MRVLGLLGQILAIVASVGLLAWWVATAGMRLATRGLERRWPLRNGPLPACAALLLLLAALVGAVVSYAALLLFEQLAPLLPEGRGWPGWVVALWHWAVWAAALLLGAAGVAAALAQAAAAWGSAQRRRHLVGGGKTAEAAGEPAPAGVEGRRIVILCDGTGNRPDQLEDGLPATTNVWKLFEALRQDETQIVWYQAGVGSDTSTTAQGARRTKRVLDAFGARAGAGAASFASRLVKLGEGAFGAGISEAITKGYTEIARQYRPGDRIYILGFSRGGFAARCIAGVISRGGLLRAENLRYAPEVVQLYRMRGHPDEALGLRPEMMHQGVAVEFLGVFDAVASLGAPLWGWWFRTLPIWKNAPFATDPAAVCRHVYHALAMDERRSQFFPTLFSRPTKPDHFLVTLEQRWFRGAHADVGGGYARTGLSDIALGWMMGAMARHGLSFRPGARERLRPDPLARAHDELARNPHWRLFGSWPRWHPVPGSDGPDPEGSRLHPSVLRRASVSWRRLGRPDLLRLRPGEAIEFAVEARRDWDRTGLVIERGAVYELAYLDGEWRDAEQEPTGPDGQGPKGPLDLRRVFAWGRRRPHEPWLRLVGTVAHPRRWDPQERGLMDLLRLLFVNDPKELTDQLAAFGRDLPKPEARIFLANDAPSGLLHLFANDWWQTASNNSGAVRLRLARVSAPEKGVPLWRLQEDGIWERRAP